MKKIMNNILAACLLSSLIACTLDDPYMPVNPEEKPAPPVVTEYQPIALTIGANGRFDVSGSSVKIGLNGKNSTYGVCLRQIELINQLTLAWLLSGRRTGNRISIIILR